MPTKPGGKSIASRFWSAAVETFAGPQEEEHYLIHISKKLILCPISCGPDAASAAQHKKKLQASADYLTRNHGDHFLVWNMTRPDKALFNSRNFDDQVLDVTRFPKYVPTLTFTFEFCNMIRYWLKQDPLNVAVILYEDARTMPHVDPVMMSINTESRIAYLVSAFLAYSKETKITFEALDLVTEIRGSDAEVAVPSQTLYYRYIDDVQSIGFSNTEPILLDCIFVHTIPQLFIDNQVEQCRPILEITCNAEKVRLDERYSNIKHPKHQSFSDKDEIMVFESLGAVLCFTLLYYDLLCFTMIYSALQARCKRVGRRGDHMLPLQLQGKQQQQGAAHAHPHLPHLLPRRLPAARRPNAALEEGGSRCVDQRLLRQFLYFCTSKASKLSNYAVRPRGLEPLCY